MMLCIPDAAEYLTVEFATRDGGTHKQRVTVLHRMRDPGPHGLRHVIEAAVKGCKRKGIAAANCLRVTHKAAVLFNYITDTTERLR